MVLREIEFGCQDVLIASEPLHELSHIRLIAQGCGVSKTRHSVSTGRHSIFGLSSWEKLRLCRYVN